MSKYILSLLFSLITIYAANAQLSFSDSIQVSLLTCSEGPDASERFGHSAVRINDLKTHEDIVFHWGVFNFNAPHFVFRFVKGETDYQLGAEYTSSFIGRYSRYGLSVKEQILNLDQAQNRILLTAILKNYEPENRVYRYSFFFDNCATRPFNIINSATDNKINFDTAWVQPISLRDMVQIKSNKGNWLDLGISLAVANRSDHQAWFEEQMFLPDFLSVAYDNASISDKPLVAETKLLLEMKPEVRSKIDSDSSLLSPFALFAFLLLIQGALFLRYKKGHNSENVLKFFESAILLVTGIAGMIIYFLNFASLHPSVDHNVNCLWLLPTNAIFAALIWVKSVKKYNRIYFFIIFALIIAYALVNFGFVHQYFNPAFALIILMQTLICYHYCVGKNSENKNEEKLI